LEPAGPFWTLDYVSKGSKRKDYDQSFRKYERELRVPYYLLFYPDAQELALYHHNGRRYVSVKPNEQARYAIPELELEMALLDGWVRFWYRGRLLPLPAELQNELTQVKRFAAGQKRRADEQQRRADEQQHRADDLQQRLAQEADARRALEEQVALLRQRLPNGSGRSAKS